ncbi:voltage-gated potassium channel [Kitasatospora sp. MAA19]|uniref:potassium channel family protein n=1 Tax=Kitasatospora sp. MAA19 TaxID=3035090 RepID=UPI00247661AA|nr:potassium channel family protein [Kitasatospora sp. MAA19]MDH6704870.1 voltage-gated potassium channel [Kitasatospora sp. MAA19]
MSETQSPPPPSPPPPPPPGGFVDLRATGLLLGSFTLLMAAYFTLPLRFLGRTHPLLGWLAFAAALTGLSTLLLAKMLGAVRGTERRPVIWLVFLIGLSMTVFATTYYVLAERTGEFEGLRTRLDALYFTIVTLATVGYGDIIPSGQGPRLVVILQIGYNFVFLAAAAGTLSRTIRAGLDVRAHRGP